MSSNREIYEEYVMDLLDETTESPVGGSYELLDAIDNEEFIECLLRRDPNYEE